MIPIYIEGGLPLVDLTVHTGTLSHIISRALIDTGSSATLLRTDDMLALGVTILPTDKIRVMTGIGGHESVIEKRIDGLSIGILTVRPFVVQLGAMDYGWGLNAIIGVDFLRSVNAVIDLNRLEVRA